MNVVLETCHPWLFFVFLLHWRCLHVPWGFKLINSRGWDAFLLPLFVVEAKYGVIYVYVLLVHHVSHWISFSSTWTLECKKEESLSIIFLISWKLGGARSEWLATQKRMHPFQFWSFVDLSLCLSKDVWNVSPLKKTFTNDGRDSHASHDYVERQWSNGRFGSSILLRFRPWWKFYEQVFWHSRIVPSHLASDRASSYVFRSSIVEKSNLEWCNL
jgi:hypothetical protein